MNKWVILLVLLLAYLAYQQSTSQQLRPQLNWVIESNPSNRDDMVLGMCHDDKYIYLVGYDRSTGDSQWRIEMREKETGRLVIDWAVNLGQYHDELRDCVVIGSRIYIIGALGRAGEPPIWAILTTRPGFAAVFLNWAREEAWASKLATDGKYLYVAGSYRKAGGGLEWRIERRTLDLNVEKVYTSTVRGISSKIEDLRINPVTGDLWIVGEIIDDRLVWRVEILDKDFNLIGSLTGENFIPQGVTFDSEGNGYVYGAFGVLKLDKWGRPLTSVIGAPYAGVYVDGRLYLLEYSFIEMYTANGELVMREPARLTNLNISITIFTNVSTRGVIPVWKAVFDGRSLYLAGSVNRSGDYRWFVASIAIPVNVSVQVLNGFNESRQWPIELENITGAVVGIGRGGDKFEVLSGKKYVVKVKALGTEISKEFVATDGATVFIVVPTAKAYVKAVDGFSRLKSWPVEIVGIAQGNGSIGPIELLGNKTYVVRVFAFGRWFNTTLYATTGTIHNVTVSVPTALLTVRAVDGFGRQRDWPLEVVGVSRGSGVVGPVEVLAGTYTARISALGAVFNKTVEVRPGENATAAVQVPTALLSAAVVDGFGSRRDWPLEIRGVAGGRGSVGPVEVVGGRKYVVAAAAFGRSFTEVVDLAPGANATVVVRVPTAKVAAKVVDSFGRQRDWPVEIVGVASGRGGVEPVEVLAGHYVARASAFGREFAVELAAEPGKVAEAVVQVPTAVLNIVVLDDDKKPLDRYVEYVAVGGSSSSKPPRELELLAGRYTVRARALGKEAAAEVELGPGEVKTVELIIPGTAGFDVGGTRVTYSTAAALVAVALAAVAGVVALALRRRRRQAK